MEEKTNNLNNSKKPINKLIIFLSIAVGFIAISSIAYASILDSQTKIANNNKIINNSDKNEGSTIPIVNKPTDNINPQTNDASDANLSPQTDVASKNNPNLQSASNLDTHTTQIGTERIIFTKKENNITQVYSSDLYSNVKLIYQTNSKSPTVSLLNNGNIYINNYSSYDLFDLNSNSIKSTKDTYLGTLVPTTLDYSNKASTMKLVPGRFLTANSSNKIVYTNDYSKSSSKTLTVYDTTTKESSIINITLNYKGGAPTVIRPIAWGKNDSDVYVTMGGWEGVQMAEVFKVNIDTKTVTRISSAGNSIIGSYKIYSQLDSILVNDNDAYTDPGIGISLKGPGSVSKISTTLNTKATYITSDNVVSNSFLSSDGKSILYQEKENEPTVDMSIDNNLTPKAEPKILSTKIYDITTKKTKDLNLTKEVLYSSSTLRYLLLKDNDGKITLYDTAMKINNLSLNNSNVDYEYIGSHNTN